MHQIRFRLTRQGKRKGERVRLEEGKKKGREKERREREGKANPPEPNKNSGCGLAGKTGNVAYWEYCVQRQCKLSWQPAAERTMTQEHRQFLGGEEGESRYKTYLAWHWGYISSITILTSLLVHKKFIRCDFGVHITYCYGPAVNAKSIYTDIVKSD